jgi:hypothetical protein
VEFEINRVTEDHIIGYANNLSHCRIGDLSGLSATLYDGTTLGLVDGGLSHYKIGGVIGTGNLMKGTQVSIDGNPVGAVRENKTSVSVFNRGPSIRTFLDDTEVRGLSCFIYPKCYAQKQTPQLILIPKRYGQFKGLFNEGDVCELRITSSSNMIKAE